MEVRYSTVVRALLQRVVGSQVQVDGQSVGQIGIGWLILLGVGRGDTPAIADQLAEKIAMLRGFEDSQGKTNLSVVDVGGAVLLVSQFTHYAQHPGQPRPPPTPQQRARGSGTARGA